MVFTLVFLLAYKVNILLHRSRKYKNNGNLKLQLFSYPSFLDINHVSGQYFEKRLKPNGSFEYPQHIC